MDMEMERRHAAFVRENGGECTVLLKKDGRFPLKGAGKIALYGSGARRTIKGGTGSGEVNSRYFVTAEEGLKAAGFEVTSTAWMDGYEKAKVDAKAKFLKDLKAEAKARKQNVLMISMGRTPPEPEYDLPLNGEGNTAVYVLSRISGEGADREPVEGEILLSKTEIRDILACKEKYENFMLIVNAGGVVDLTPVQSVGNILVLSQLGADTGHILADILLGKQVPSGKLTTTWAAWSQYPDFVEFGEKHDTHYREGIYVGYRYFDTVGAEPLYPFGYGLSYTDFAVSEVDASLDGQKITVTAKVRNVGSLPGKEVVQVYTSIPSGKLDEPYQVLSGFAKTSLLTPGAEETLSVTYRLQDIAPYDTDSASYILEAGDYIVRAGVSSRNTQVAAVVRLAKTVATLCTKNVLGQPDFADWKAPAAEQKVPENAKILELDPDCIMTKYVSFAADEEIDPAIAALTREQLIKMNLGAYKPGSGVASIIGNAGYTVAGAAGQSNMDVGIPSMVMADGPAGLRLSKEYALDAKGEVHSMESSIPASMLDFMSKPMRWILSLSNYRPKKTDKILNQYCTAIPIGTAIAQSFNTALAEEFGKVVGEEMEHFGVHLWLAPALNIHRSIRCGRNFEYYSEDPYVSGVFAAAITKGVQTFSHAGTTIKHYAFNNQEHNRTQNSSQLSERAAREIYLRGFGICVKLSQPKAVMTSYNLVNGKHTSEHSGLIGDILRAEYGYKGIVMTDWVIAGYESEKNCIHPVANAGNVAAAGGDLFMPGSQHDFDCVKAALDAGTLTEKQLKVNATRVLRMAKQLVK